MKEYILLKFLALLLPIMGLAQVVFSKDTIAFREGKALPLKGDESTSQKINDVRQLDMVIYYRFDKSIFDSTYLSNSSTIRQIDSLMQLKSAHYIDSLRIVGHASPEGPVEYNRRLSRRRAQAMKDYLLKQYPNLIHSQTVVCEAGGENWEGFRRMAERDPELPLKDQVLKILSDNRLNDKQRQSRIERLNHGTLYKNYLLPRYYRYLRSGASLFFVYNSKMPPDIHKTVSLLSVSSEKPKLPDSLIAPQPSTLRPLSFGETTVCYIRPFALKTNVLGNLFTLFNVELEFPLDKHFSVLGEWSFPFWGGLGNAGGIAPLPLYSETFTLQMLSGGVEGRYWFARRAKLDELSKRWGDYNPLNGWFVGLYGGAGLYDLQMGQHGVQGTFYISGGVSGGFAHSIGKHLHMEYSTGIGYIETRYYNYQMKNGHKVVDIRPDGVYDYRRQSYVGPTKLKVSLVWIPQFRVKGQPQKMNQ